MYIKFWGTRGSIPTPLSSAEIREKIRLALKGAAGLDLTDETVLDHYLERLPFTIRGTAGGNTTCIEVRSGDQLLIIDMGSGLRLLGFELMAKGFGRGGQQADILITHTHWDHIHGFPFFGPAFIPGNRLVFYSPFPDLADRLIQQQHEPFFPVSIDYMRSDKEYKEIPEQEWSQIGKFRIYPMRLSHPGVTYGYRIEDGHRCLVFASDSEYKRVDPQSTEAYVKFFSGADLLVFDAQYTWTEALDKPDWGHSSAITGAEMAYRADVKKLALVHHDPTSSDEKIWAAKEQAEGYLARRHPNHHLCEVLVAYDGLSLEL
jgi:phosphoribosyl 1,2-cyclic phosphodiesterase